MRQGRKWLLVAMLFVAFEVVAEDVWVDDVCYSLMPANNTAEVTLGMLAGGDVVIPPVVTHDGVKYAVVGVGKNAFSSSSITSIVLPESVKRIGDYAFSACSNLGSVALPKGGVDIGRYAFANCRGIGSMAFPKGEVCVESYAFAECSGLASVSVSENSNLTVGSDVFYGCRNLERVEVNCENVGDWFRWNETIKEVVLGEQVVTIGEDAFWDCSNLVSVVVPDDSRLTTIGAGAFKDCCSLASINIPEGVTSIGERAFEYCSSLTSITIPASMTDIDSYAFYECVALERITINCAHVGRWFNGNAAIKEIVLGEGVEMIANNAFYDCSGLMSIVIPQGVTSMGSGAFLGCSSLTSIVVAEGNKVYDSRGGCNAIVETASNTLMVGCSATVVPEDILGIGSYAFAGCVDLSSVVLPEGVTTIEHSAFYDCSNLVSISIPASVTSLGSSAFSGCARLASVDIPEGVTTIKEWTFEDCSSLSSIDIPMSVDTIGYRAFAGCTGLASLTSHAVVPPTCVRDAFSGVNTAIPVYVPLTSVAAYQSANEWGLFTNYVGVDTGINNPIVEVQNQGLVYDLHGRRIAESANFKGVCIVNGKKVVLK